MYAKTTTLFTTTILSLVFYGLSTSPVLANSSQKSLQGIPSNYADTKVGLPETQTLKALKQGTDISQAEPPALPALNEPPASTVTPAPEPPALPAPEPPALPAPEPPAQTLPSAQTVPPPSLNQNQKVSGIINSVNGTTAEIKLADGTSKNYQLNSNLVNSPNMVKGAFVNFLVDENQIVQEVQPAVVENTIEGIVRGIDGNLVTLQLADGSLTTTTVAPAVSTRMGLVPGTPLVVTSYQGIASTKVCFGQPTPPPLPPVIQAPPRFIPPVIQNPPPVIPRKRPKPVRALW